MNVAKHLNEPLTRIKEVGTASTTTVELILSSTFAKQHHTITHTRTSETLSASVTCFGFVDAEELNCRLSLQHTNFI